MRRPVIIVGAPRSGTNLLRDVLCALPSFVTWPCDELNPMWKYGVPVSATDDLTVDDATPHVQEYVRARFHRLAARHPAARVIEKTCANTLRVNYVRAIVPEAQIIHLVRDGREAALSAVLRWQAVMEPSYMLRKARWAPARKLLPLVASAVAGRIRQLRSDGRTLNRWGPMTPELVRLSREAPIEIVCAAQWSACASAAATALREDEQVHVLRYEDFVGDPRLHVSRLLAWTGETCTDDELNVAVSRVAPDRGGRWEQLSPALRDSVMKMLEPGLAATGYV